MSTYAETLQLINACKSRDMQTVQALISSGVDVNGFSSDNMRPIIMASFIGDIEIVKLLLKSGSNPNVKDDEGRSPLGAAISLNHWSIMEILFRNGASSKILSHIEMKLKKGHDEEIFNKLQNIYSDGIDFLDKRKGNDAVKCFMEIEDYNFFDPYLNYYINYHLIFMAILEIICGRPNKSLEILEMFNHNTQTLINMLNSVNFSTQEINMEIKDNLLEQVRGDKFNVDKLHTFIKENGLIDIFMWLSSGIFGIIERFILSILFLGIKSVQNVYLSL